MNDDIPSVGDLIADYEVLDGDKVKLDSILNVPILVIGWRIAPSIQKQCESCLTIQFIRVGEVEKHVCFTGSNVLIDQIREIESALDARNLPHKFKAVVRKIGKYYKFFSEA